MSNPDSRIIVYETEQEVRLSIVVAEAIEECGRSPESLLKILQYVNKLEGHVSKQSMLEIAKQLDIASAKVYSVASFYHYIHLRPMGKHIIYVCKTISCQMKNRKDVVNSIKTLLKIGFGETTEDEMFSLLEVSCLGQCDKAPAIMIGEVPYGDLTPEKVRHILEDYRQFDGVNVIKEEACYE